MASARCWGCGDETVARWPWLRLTSRQSPWCWQNTGLWQTEGQHLSFTITADGFYKTVNSHTTPPRKHEASLHRNLHRNAWRNWPIRGTESEVAGIISATISMKTVSESRTVMPGSRHKTPGEKSLLKDKRRKEMHQGKDQELTAKYNRNSYLSVTQWLLTQADLLPRVCRQQEDQQSHGGEQHAGDEQIEGVKQGPPS